MRIALTLFFFLTAPALANEKFRTGPVFEEFGPHAAVEGAAPIPADTKFAIRFDTADQSDEGGRNKTFVSAARFINMHAAAGVAPENIDLAIVIHGGAVKDVVNEARFKKEQRGVNANAALIAALQQLGVKFFVCGQSAAAYDVATADLLPGVEMSLSAMTTHALLDAQGFALNPF